MLIPHSVPPDSYPAETEPVEIYRDLGDGTIHVGGDTISIRAANRAFTCWKRGVYPIEFFFLGANAGNQAIKAAQMLIRELKNSLGIYAAVVPRWAATMTKDPFTEKVEKKQGLVLRIVQIPVDSVRAEKTSPTT